MTDQERAQQIEAARQEAWTVYLEKMAARRDTPRTWPPQTPRGHDLYVHHPEPSFVDGKLAYASKGEVPGRKPHHRALCGAYGPERTYRTEPPTDPGAACPHCERLATCDHDWKHEEWGAPRVGPQGGDPEWRYVACSKCGLEVACFSSAPGERMWPDEPFGWNQNPVITGEVTAHHEVRKHKPT